MPVVLLKSWSKSSVFVIPRFNIVTYGKHSINGHYGAAYLRTQEMQALWVILSIQ